MAKVILPLLSQTASGQFAHSMVFDKRNFVRKYVVPANPQTVGQMAVRNQLGDIQRSLKTLGLVLRVQLKAGFGSRWNSLIVGELTATGGAVLAGYTAEFNAFVAGDKTAWATADTSVPVTLADGLALYACASAAYDIALRLGATLTLALPATANSATVGAEWVANA